MGIHMTNQPIAPLHHDPREPLHLDPNLSSKGVDPNWQPSHRSSKCREQASLGRARVNNVKSLLAE